MSYSLVAFIHTSASLSPTANLIGSCRNWGRNIGFLHNKRYDLLRPTSSKNNFNFNRIENKRNRFANKPRISLSSFFPQMELPFPFYFIAVILLSLPFLSLLIKGSKKKKKKSMRLPPGPRKLPVIGHMHHILSSLPHHYPLWDLAKEHGPLMHLQFGEVDAIIVSSAEIAKEFLKTHDLLCADRPRSVATEILWYNNTDIVFCPYGDYWRQMRKICIMELLSNKNVRSFEHIRKDEASILIEFVKSTRGEPFNVTEKIFRFMNSMTSRAAFGNASIDRDEAIKLIKRAIGLAGHFDLADVFPSMKIFGYINWNKFALLKLRRKLDRLLDSVIQEHSDKILAMKTRSGELGTEDLVDVLLRLKDNGELDFPINNDNIKSIILDMFSGGTDTSSSTVDWAMAELMKHPRVMTKAQVEIREAFKGKKWIEEFEIRELNYLKLVINETLRLHPPVSLIPRSCREEFKINGYDIPLNANIIVNVWALGRDPNYWHNPESFEPERFETNPINFLGSHFEYIPFGSGRRICPGMNFGVVNAEYVLAQLLYHFDWELPQGLGHGDIDMSEIDGFVISRKNGLFVVAKSYI